MSTQHAENIILSQPVHRPELSERHKITSFWNLVSFVSVATFHLTSWVAGPVDNLLVVPSYSMLEGLEYSVYSFSLGRISDLVTKW